MSPLPSVLYFSETGKQPRVSRALLDGSEQTVILDADLTGPSALTFYQDTLYMVDARQNNKTRPRFMTYDARSKLWTPLKISSNFSVSYFN